MTSSFRLNTDKFLREDYRRPLEKQLAYILRFNPFYINKFRETLSRNHLINFCNLPFTDKKELLENQIIFPPFGNYLSINSSQISRIHKTSGTTNTPLLLALTRNDILNTIKTGSACFRLSGVSEKDIVIHCLNYNMWAGGYTDYQSLEEAGAGVIPFGVGQTKELITTILQVKPTAIHCTPSYLRKIETILIDEFGMNPSMLGLKLGLFGAEPGLQNPSFRRMIEEKWEMKAMNANYGLSDVLSMFGSECRLQSGIHFMGGNVLYPELIEITSNRNIEITTGATGELVLSNLCKEAQPLLRYRTGDIIKIVSADSCSCGEKSFRFEIIGRTDDMIVIRGINVFVGSIGLLISENLDNLTGNYQIHISRNDPIDEILILVEVRNYTYAEKAMVKQSLSEIFRTKLSIKPKVVLCNEGALPVSEGKTKHLFRIL